MHPAEFVRNRIKERKIDEIIELIRQFKSELDNGDQKITEKHSNFINLFLLSVVGQLRQLGPDQDLHDDNLLTVWAELGYYGIERHRLPE